MITKNDINEVVAEALDVLKRGGLILYPTDTVWGIGCDATNEAAVQRVFALKRRAEAKSLVLLACDLDMVARYIRKIPSIAVDLVSVNDAPMTIVYPGAVVAGEGAASDPVRGSAAHPSQPGGWAPRSEGNRGPRKSADFWGAHAGGTPLGGSTSPALAVRAPLMRSRYCIRYELGLCPVHQGAKDTGPLFLVNNGRRLSLGFDCARCEMTVYAQEN